MMTGKMDSFVGSFGAEIMLKQLQAMQAEGPGVLQAVDIECIHRMRVASRRLRAAQSLFDDFLPKRRVVEWESLIKKVTRSLGQARDLDIQLETLQRFRLTVMDTQCKPGSNRLYLRLLQSRVNAQKQVDRSVQKFSSAGVLKYISPRLIKAMEVNPQPEEYASSLYVLASQSIQKRLEEFLSYEEYIQYPEKIAELHAMRIAAKRLRYTLEIFDPIYPDGLKQWLKPLKEIQELLGLIHDCDVWDQYLTSFVEEEKELTRQYFGHLRGFSKILPGIRVFQQNRASDRTRQYVEFLSLWHTGKKKRIWQKLPRYLTKYMPEVGIPSGQEQIAEEVPTNNTNETRDDTQTESVED